MENQSYCNIPDLRPLGQNIKRNIDSFSKGEPTLFMTVCMYCTIEMYGMWSIKSVRECRDSGDIDQIAAANQDGVGDHLLAGDHWGRELSAVFVLFVIIDNLGLIRAAN